MPDSVRLWLPRGDEHDLAASLGMCDPDRNLLKQLIDGAREQTARDLPGVPVMVHRWHVWRVVRAMQRLGVTNTPDEQIMSATQNQIVVSVAFEDAGEDSWRGPKDAVKALQAANWEAPNPPKTITVGGSQYRFVGHVSNDATRRDEYTFAAD